MISALFTALADIVSGFATLLVEIFESAVAIFYNSTSGLTVVGTLTLMGLGTGLVIWGFYFIRSLIRVRHKA